MLETLFHLVTFGTWWENLLAYLVVAWSVAVSCSRFGPRECPKFKTSVDRDQDYRTGKVTTRVIRMRYTDDQCVGNLHPHVTFRKYAVVWGILWLPALILAIPCVIVGTAVWAGMVLGNVEVVEKKRKIDQQAREVSS